MSVAEYFLVDVCSTTADGKTNTTRQGVNWTQYPDGTWSAQIDPVFPGRATSVRVNTNTKDLVKLGMLRSVLSTVFNAAVEFNLVLQYMPGARDDALHPGRSWGLLVYAGIINAQKWTTVTCLDPHSNVTPAVLERYVSNDWAFDFFDSVLVQVLNETPVPRETPYVIMTPDGGATKRYQNVVNHAIKLGFQHVEATKTRNPHSGVLSAPSFFTHADVVLEQAIVVIIDDICSRGGTFKALCPGLMEKGVKDIYLAVSHYEYTADPVALVDAGISKVFTTSSFPSTVEYADSSLVNVIDVELK